MTPERRRDLSNRRPDDLSDDDLVEWLREAGWRDHMLHAAADRLEALSRAVQNKE